MWLVVRNTLKKVRAIPASTQYILVRYFSGKPIAASQKKEAQALLQEAHENGYWLACDCTQANGEPPLMYVRRFESGHLTLVRMPNRTAHLKSCAFWFTENIAESASISSALKVNSWDKEQPLNLHLGLETSLKDEVGSDEERNLNFSTKARIPRLGRLLYSLLTEVGLNKIKVEMLNITEQFNKIRDKTQEYKLAKDISLSDYCWTFPNQIEAAAVKLKTAKNWPDTARPYGIFIVRVEKFEKNIAFCKNGEENIKIELTGKLALSSGRLGEVSGPFLLIFTISDLPTKPGVFLPVNGFAVPIYSNYLLTPVESSYERMVLQKLIQLAQALQKKECPITIYKPLFDIKSECRPDFILKTKDKTIVLEVMGSDEKEYLERKTKTHKAMGQLGQLILFNAHEANKNNQWNEKLDVLAKQVYRLLLT